MNEKLIGESHLLTLERLLKPTEIADLLNISRSFAYHLLQTGVIPTVRLGTACRVRPRDLAEYIEKNIHHQSD